MDNVYDLIEELRDRSHLSTHRLAMLAEMGSSTLAAMLSRRAEKVTVRNLKAVAKVFRMKWNDMLKIPDEEAEKYRDTARVSAKLKPGVGENILARWSLEMENEAPIDFDDESTDASQLRRSRREKSKKNHFHESILFVLERLNDEGLMEIMRVALDMARNPEYCLPAQDENWQDTK